MKKRIVSSIMCLAMLLSLLSATAFALDESGGTTTTPAITVSFKADGEKAKEALEKNDCERDTLYFSCTGLDAEKEYWMTLEFPADANHEYVDGLQTGDSESAAVTQEELASIKGKDSAGGYVSLKTWTGSTKSFWEGLTAGTYTLYLYNETDLTDVQNPGGKATSVKTLNNGAKEVAKATITLEKVTIDCGTKVVNTVIMQGEDKTETFYDLVQDSTTKAEIYVDAKDLTNAVAESTATLKSLASLQEEFSVSEWTYNATTKTFSIVPNTKLTAVATTGNVLGMNMTNVQTDIEAAPANAENVIKVTGTSKYVVWDGFSSVPEQKYGNYVALTLTLPDGKDAYITSPTEGDLVKAVDEDGILITNLKNFADEDYVTVVKVGESKEEGGKTVLDTSKPVVEYVLDFSRVTREPATITSVTNKDVTETALGVRLANGTAYLSGAVTFAAEATTSNVTLLVSVNNCTPVEVPAVIKNTNGALTADAVTVMGATLNINTTDLFIKNNDSTATPAVTPPSVVTPDFEDRTKQEAAAAAATAINDEDTEVEKEVLANAAAQMANKEETKAEDALSTAQKTALAAVEQPGTELGKIQAAVAAGTEDAFDSNTVSLVVNVYAKIEIADIEPATGNDPVAPTTLKLSITPMAQTVLTTADPTDPTAEINVLKNDASNKNGANAVLVSEEPAPINTPTAVSIKLPNTYAAGSYIIEHIKNGISYFYEGTVDSNHVLSFTSTHGFSDFVIYAENPCAAKIGDTLYKTLSDAVNAVGNKGTIVLQKDCDETVVVSKEITFTLDLNDNQFTGTISAGNNYTLEKEGNTYTFTRTGGGGGGGNGGGGGGSTTKPTDPTNPTNPTDPGNNGKTEFTDVPSGAYYEDAVKWAVDNGITNGLTATTFGPNNSCTRGQMVTFLWRAAGSPAATGTNSFSDVASGEYYYNAVLWAVEKGITNGTSATTFSPNATVNRAQTVTFLYRYAESPAATGDTGFTDVASNAYYADAVKWAVAEGITNGTSATTFAPASNCTRGQIVSFLYRQIAE